MRNHLSETIKEQIPRQLDGVDLEVFDLPRRVNRLNRRHIFQGSCLWVLIRSKFWSDLKSCIPNNTVWRISAELVQVIWRTKCIVRFT